MMIKSIRVVNEEAGGEDEDEDDDDDDDDGLDVL